MTEKLSGLVAYPGSPREIGETIRRALELLSRNPRTQGLRSWEENDIPGHFIGTDVLTSIGQGSIFLADITELNFNVVFEIGFAVGQQRRAFLIRNEALRTDVEQVRRIGIFDTLGHANYSDSQTLSSVVSAIEDLRPLHQDSEKRSRSAPVFLLLPTTKGDVETHLIARIKKSRLVFRSFDPEEHGRLSGLDAIEHVSLSHGVVVPLLGRHYVESDIHNMRAAFVAGLAMGMERQLLLLQSGDEPVPLDYRDLARSFRFMDQMDDHVAEFATAVVASMQSWVRPVSQQSENLLARLTLGSSSAENEYQELGEYYLETDEFHRAARGEAQIVLGRKGSGKTALFFQLRDRLRRDSRIVVLDLKPEGFQLLKFKEQVLDLLEEGTREHTITAYWEYLLLLEICHKLLQEDRTLHIRNHKLYEPYQRLAASYASDQYVSEGDFAERMLRLTQRIAEDFASERDPVESPLRMSAEEVTELLYKHDLADLRFQLTAYLAHKGARWILFDNLDKGWPPHGVSTEDVLSLRCLLDAMGKMEREFRRRNTTTHGIIFIRNDVYENLVAAMPDRGKLSHALVDWTDPALLLEILRRRFLCSGIEHETDFDSIWHQICVPMVRGEASQYYLVDRCLMRPRALIDFLRHCRSHAINLGHTKIDEDDINHGEERYSTQLVNDISYEIQDVFPPAANVLYEFIECPVRLNAAELTAILEKVSNNPDEQARTLELLLWYGVLGFQREGGEPSFIYSVRYDIRRLRALLTKRESEGVVYVINPAFWKGLEIKRNTRYMESSNHCIQRMPLRATADAVVRRG